MHIPRLLSAASALPLLTGTALALTPTKDSFNGKTIKKTRWDVENSSTKAAFLPANGKLNFTVAGKPTDDDYSILTLKKVRPSYNESWEMTLDVANTSSTKSTVGVGFQVFNAADPTDLVALEFFGKSGFFGVFITDDEDDSDQDLEKNPGVTKGSLKISFDKTSKLITLSYDKDGSANGFIWKKMGTFSPTGTGGDRRGNWNMNSQTGAFGIELYGFAEESKVTNGQASIDNFVLKPVK